MNRYKLHKAGVAVNDAIMQLGGDKELYEELLQTFRKENRIAELEAALDSGDVKAAFAAAHAMKGEAGNMGFTKLYEALCILVDRLRSGTLDGTKDMYEAVKSAYDVLIEAIG